MPGHARAPRRCPLTTLFKIVAFLLLLVNVSMHGLVALFIGGPFGLGVYLVGFAAFWTTCWFTLRRSREAGPTD